MKKFQFRLERILHYRDLVRDEKKKVLVEKRIALQNAEERLLKLQHSRDTNHPPEQAQAVEMFVLGAFYGSGIINRIERQHQVIENCQQEVDAAYQEYLIAVQEAEALRRLKERRLEEYKEECAREEQQNIDETVTQRAKKRQRQR
jgi:flagellar export protein FliJ